MTSLPFSRVCEIILYLAMSVAMRLTVMHDQTILKKEKGRSKSKAEKLPTACLFQWDGWTRSNSSAQIYAFLKFLFFYFRTIVVNF